MKKEIKVIWYAKGSFWGSKYPYIYFISNFPKWEGAEEITKATFCFKKLQGIKEIFDYKEYKKR